MHAEFLFIYSNHTRNDTKALLIFVVPRKDFNELYFNLLYSKEAEIKEMV